MGLGGWGLRVGEGWGRGLVVGGWDGIRQFSIASSFLNSKSTCSLSVVLRQAKTNLEVKLTASSVSVMVFSEHHPIS